MEGQTPAHTYYVTKCIWNRLLVPDASAGWPSRGEVKLISLEPSAVSQVKQVGPQASPRKDMHHFAAQNLLDTGKWRPNHPQQSSDILSCSIPVHNLHAFSVFYVAYGVVGGRQQACHYGSAIATGRRTEVPPSGGHSSRGTSAS